MRNSTAIPHLCLIKSRRYPLTSAQVVDGGTLHVFQLVKALSRRGFRIDVFTRRELDEPPVMRHGRVTVFNVPYDRSSATDTLERDYQESESFVSALVRSRYFRPRQYIALHTHHWTSATNLQESLPPKCRLFHTPHLLALEKARHNGQTLPPAVEESERKVLHRAEAVFALSASEASVISTHYQVGEHRIFVTPNGVGREFFELPGADLPEARLSSLLFVGRLCRQKGLDILVEAVAALVDRGLSPSATVIGGHYGEPAYEQAVLGEIEKRNLRSRFRMAGQIGHEMIPHLMRESAVYVQPSRYESQGIALLEAMASGRVVVASDLPAIREYVTDGHNGFLVRPGDADRFAETIQHITENPSVAAGIAARARTRARQFTWAAAWKIVIPLLSGRSVDDARTIC